MEEKIQKQIKEELKKGNKEKVLILRTILGELQRTSSKSELTEEQAIKIMKKMIDSSTEMAKLRKQNNQDPYKEEIEIEILNDLVPMSLGLNDIRTELNSIKKEIINMDSDGPAMGLAMKHFKSKNFQVEGKDVKIIVEEIRKNNNG